MCTKIQDKLDQLEAARRGITLAELAAEREAEVKKLAEFRRDAKTAAAARQQEQEQRRPLAGRYLRRF